MANSEQQGDSKMKGKYEIKTDNSQYILYKRNIIRNGKHKGEEELIICGYFRDLSQLYNYLVDKQILNNFEDVKQMMKIKEELKEFISQSLRELNK